MLNNFTGIGRLTKDPESKYTADGVAIANFTIAIDRDFKDKDTGEKTADFLPCVAWRQPAEFITQYVTKGRQVGVEGRIQTRNYVGQDGNKRYVTEVIVNRVYPVGPNPNADGASEAPNKGRKFDDDDFLDD